MLLLSVQNIYNRNSTIVILCKFERVWRTSSVYHALFWHYVFGLSVCLCVCAFSDRLVSDFSSGWWALIVTWVLPFASVVLAVIYRWRGMEWLLLFTRSLVNVSARGLDPMHRTLARRQSSAMLNFQKFEILTVIHHFQYGGFAILDSLDACWGHSRRALGFYRTANCGC